LRFLLRAVASFTAAAGVLALVLAGAAAQQPEPGAPSVTFQLEVNYVDIDAVVTDEQGGFVADLTKDDFELYEDGRPQAISTFSLVDIPMPQPGRAGGAAPAAPSDVKSNAQPISGRLFVIVLDDLNVSAFRSQVVVKAAREFVERYFGPNDIAAVTYTSGRTDGAQEFTSDKALLLAAINKFQGRKLRSIVLEKADYYFQQTVKELEATADEDNPTGKPLTGRGAMMGSTDVTNDPDDFERGHRAQQVLGTLRRLAEFMGGIRGRRKAILMFSEGIDYPIYDVFGSPAATTVMMETRNAIASAARSNVSFFALDPRGLLGMTSEAIELQASTQPQLKFDVKGLLEDMYLSQDSLRTLADETGGYAAVNATNVGRALERIVRANSMYYVLGYYPEKTPRDGRFHKIEVRTKRPGLRVSARKGYVSPRPPSAEDTLRVARERERGRGRAGDAQTSDELREIMTQPLQKNGLTLTVHAAPFKGASRDASVALAVEVDASRLNFVEQNETFANGLELSLFAFDERGRAQGGNFAQFNLALRPETFERVRGSVVRMNPRMTLRPGRYQLRVGVRESGAGQMGTVFYDLEVPDFTARGLSMSGLLVTDEAARGQFTPGPDDQLPSGALPGPATSRRTFRQGDRLGLFAEIYDGLPARDRRDLETITTLVADDGTAVFTSRESIDRSDARGDSRASQFPFAKQIPLAGVKPGGYRLRVEARVVGGNDVTPVVRETAVTVN
jgi:VWFA-related protein